MGKRWEEASAYIRQARSNQALGDFLFQHFCAKRDERREEFWCHVVAQYQQSVEKAIKALFCLGNLDFPKTHRADQLLFFLLKRSSLLNFNAANLKQLSKLFGKQEKKL
jgi:HEPN domain-containing protein